MIYDLKITTASGTRFNEMISQRFKWIREQGYSVTTQMVYQQPGNDMEAYEIHLQGNHNNQVFRNEDIVYIFKHQLAEMIAEHILGNGKADSLIGKFTGLAEAWQPKRNKSFTTRLLSFSGAVMIMRA